MPVIDTHCHLNILEEKGMDPETALENARMRGLDTVIQIATDAESSRYNKILSERINKLQNPVRLYWTAGLHPESADRLNTLEEIFSIIRDSLSDPFFMGIGETGLDYFHTTQFEKQQKESFEAHLNLASELCLPIILHLRDAKSYSPDNIRTVTDALEMIKKFNNVKGVLHCYTYGPDEAAEFIEMGWYVSFSGILTYKNARIIQDAAVAFPLNRILVETDAPFLTPMPNRGKVNQPAFTADTLDFLVKLRSEALREDPDEIIQTIYNNSLEFIAIKNNKQVNPDA